MPSTPRLTLENDYAVGRMCAICGATALRVVHVQTYPDYVTCELCGSAFVTEEGGERVLFGAISLAYPKTQHFAQRQWLEPKTVEEVAVTERPPSEGPPSPEILLVSEPEELLSGKGVLLAEEPELPSSEQGVVLTEDEPPALRDAVAPPTEVQMQEGWEGEATSAVVEEARSGAPIPTAEAPPPSMEAEEPIEAPDWLETSDTAGAPPLPEPGERMQAAPDWLEERRASDKEVTPLLFKKNEVAAPSPDILPAEDEGEAVPTFEADLEAIPGVGGEPEGFAAAGASEEAIDTIEGPAPLSEEELPPELAWLGSAGERDLVDSAVDLEEDTGSSSWPGVRMEATAPEAPAGIGLSPGQDVSPIEEGDISTPPHGMGEGLPEWMQAAEGEGASLTGASEPERPMVTEPGTDMPEWLQPAEAEEEGLPEIAEQAPMAAGMEEGLPAWLQAAEVGETGPVEVGEVEEPKVAEPDAGLPEWLQAAGVEETGPVEAGEVEEPMVAELTAGLPEWLQAAEVEGAGPAEALEIGEDATELMEGVPGWLEGAEIDEVSEAPAVSLSKPHGEPQTREAVSPADAVGEPATVDWLSQIEAEAARDLGEQMPGAGEATPAFTVEQGDQFFADTEAPVRDAGVRGAPIEGQVTEPPPGRRYRVTVQGGQVRIPAKVCAHCQRTPARRSLDLISTMADGKGERRRVTISLSLCASCRKRIQARSGEERNARLQAFLTSMLLAVLALVITLALGVVKFQDSLLDDLLLLMLISVISFAIPAFVLLSRASRTPPPPDAVYVRTTLFIPEDPQGQGAAFEWRNPSFAQRFKEANAPNVIGDIEEVEDRLGSTSADDGLFAESETV